MILYTVMPHELMFHNEEDYGKQSIVNMNGVSLLVEQSGEEWKVVRLLSSDPNHFLNASYSPGQVIQSKLQV